MKGCSVTTLDVRSLPRAEAKHRIDFAESQRLWEDSAHLENTEEALYESSGS